MSDNKIEVQVLEGQSRIGLAKLKDILQRKLVIPSYQRPYAWDKEDIEDIFKTISYTNKNQENICFFGSIILSSEDNAYPQQEEYYIIDGQQRITSFLLLIRLFLKKINELIKDINGKNQKYSDIQKMKDLWEKQSKLEEKKKDLENLIKKVSLRREQSQGTETEQDILNFIKEGGTDLKNSSFKEIQTTIYEEIERTVDECNNISDLNSKTPEDLQNIKSVLHLLDFILNNIKFCFICITGKNSENFAINLFNTLNTTGQPLTAFETLKSELYTINQKLSEEINKLQDKIMKEYTKKRQKVISHTGKLLLYLPLYRGDFKEINYTLSNTKFKDQREYLKQVLLDKPLDQKKEIAPQLVEDIKTIDNFYSKYWLKRETNKKLLKNKDEQLCFQFLSDLNHDRILPIIIRFYKSNKDSLGQCVKHCTAFSSLWRAFHEGGTSGIDKAYKEISKNLKTTKIINLNKELKKWFIQKLSSKKTEELTLNDLKDTWIEKLKTSAVYKNKKLTRFLLFLAYNKRYFDTEKNILKKGKGLDILDIFYWLEVSDYKTIEHIIPQNNKKAFGLDTLGNLTLLPQSLNSSLGDKSFKEKRKEYKKFCQTENEDKYPYLPLLKHISNYNKFTEKEIKDRTKILSEFIWEILVEDWLGWKD